MKRLIVCIGFVFFLCGLRMRLIDLKPSRDKGLPVPASGGRHSNELLVQQITINTPWDRAQLKHNDRWKVYDCLIETWPRGVVLKSMQLDERKISLRGKTRDIALLSEIGAECSCHRKIVQQLQSKKTYTEFLCDIYLS